MPEIMDIMENKSVMGLKEKGNQLFSKGEYEDALQCYMDALNMGCDKTEKLILFKNLAAVYLKKKDHGNAIKSASDALSIDPHDLKALFRRCQAYESIGKYQEAFIDARLLQQIDPKNASNQATLQRLNVKLQEIAKEQSSTSNKVKSMLKCLEDESLSAEKKAQVANNILVLSRDDVGADLIIMSDGLSLITKILRGQFDLELKLSCVRTLSELAKSEDRCKTLLKFLNDSLDFLFDLMVKHTSLEFITATQYLIQVMVCSLSGIDLKNLKPKNTDFKVKNQEKIDKLMVDLVNKCPSRVMCALGRDAILELIMRNVDLEVLNWGMKLIEANGLSKLLEVASEVDDIKYECSMDITKNTRSHVSVTLDRIYLCMDHDKAREMFRDKVMEYINSKLKGLDIENKVRATAAITCLLQGPVDVGNFCLSQQGVVEMMLAMAGSQDETQQRVAAEALIAAASKKDKCSSISSMGAGILKNLYQSKNDSIKVRALVGLCKLGSVGGTDASVRPFSDSSVMKLASACKKFLLNPSKDKDLKKWAAEGLAYLTLDGDVKEDLISDKDALNALIELAKYGDLSVLYGVITTFVNITNSYDEQEVIPEMLELAKFAKQHVPEEHPKDSKEFVSKRCRVLSELNVTSALVALSKTESKTSRELICRVFNAICEQQDLRGGVVQNGGSKALLEMALGSNTEKGKREAAQALSRIGITINPDVAFPGQRAAEVVRPIMSLLHQDCTALQNFEALMALTNLAQVNGTIQTKILNDHGFSKIESYMYEDHELLKRAATQCVANLIANPDVVKLFEGDNDRIKYLVVLSGEDDLECAKAAAGALAMVTSVSKKACEKVFDSKSWLEILIMLTSSKDQDLQHRGVFIVNNIIQSDETIAEKIVDTNVFEILMAIVRPEVDDVPEKIKQLARDALKKAEEYKLIKPLET